MSFDRRAAEAFFYTRWYADLGLHPLPLAAVEAAHARRRVERASLELGRYVQLVSLMRLTLDHAALARRRVKRMCRKCPQRARPAVQMALQGVPGGRQWADYLTARPELWEVLSSRGVDEIRGASSLVSSMTVMRMAAISAGRSTASGPARKAGAVRTGMINDIFSLLDMFEAEGGAADAAALGRVVQEVLIESNADPGVLELARGLLLDSVDTLRALDMGV